MSQSNEEQVVATAAVKLHQRYGAQFTRRLAAALGRLLYVETGELPAGNGLELSAAAQLAQPLAAPAAAPAVVDAGDTGDTGDTKLDSAAMALARWYADLLNALQLADQAAAHKVAEDANDELEDTGWLVEQDSQGQWKASDVSEDDGAELSFGWELSRAIGEKWQGKNGRWFTRRQDGRVVPTRNPNAQPKQGARERARAAYASGRQVNRQELSQKLAGHRQGDANIYQRQRARLSAHMLMRHHGVAAAHRVEELASTLETAIQRTQGDDRRSAYIRDTLKGKLSQLGLALEAFNELEKARQAGSGGRVSAGQHLGEGVSPPGGSEPAGTGQGAGGGPGKLLPGADSLGDADGGAAGGARNATRRGKRTGKGGAVQPELSPRDESLLEPPTPKNPTDLSAGNWQYTDRDFYKGGLKAKFKANIEAIKTLRNIRLEGRSTATPAEQAILARYTGWGQFPQLFGYSWNPDWQKERDQLRALLSNDEYEAAQRSTLNAHYTHPDVVDAHWKMARRLGFDGGRFLETSAGVGYYLGLMPPDLAAQTRSSAVELDKTTGSILGLLYPKANVKVQGFEKFDAPDNFYDLIASNVPFGDYRIHDPRYNKHQANIHDYFFLKSADKVRPGGLIMHITSAGTLDKSDSSIRQALAEKGLELVSAVRFPAGAHKENAGTDVVTDMLILRKKHPGEAPVHPTETPPEAEPKQPGFTGITVDSLGRLYHWKDGKRVPGPDWQSTTTVPDPAGGEPIRINRYFADNPQQVLGIVDRTGSMYTGDQANVSKTDDYEQRLEQAIASLPEGVLKKVMASPERFAPETAPEPGATKVGGYMVKDGKLFVRDGGAMVEQTADRKALERIQAHLTLRDAVRGCINDQLNGVDATESRKRLNEVYDAFVKKHGFVNLPANKRAFRADPDSPVLLALEKYDPEKKTAAKADIFHQDVIGAVGKTERVDTVNEALGVSLHESGRLDLARMGQVLGWHPERVAMALAETDLAYEDPQDGWKPADQYLSGNVRRKLAMARAAAETDPRYQKNVEALEKVQPVDVEHTDIDVKLGAPWVPPSDIASFAATLLEGQPNHFSVEYSPHTGEWSADFSRDGEWLAKRRLAREVWGTGGASFDELLEAALNGRTLTIYGKADANGKRPVDVKATEDANGKISEIKQAFKDWIWEDDDRRNRLHRFYNDNFNNVRLLKYNGSHQTFPGLNPAIKLRDHQKNFVWQVVTTGKGLAAHEVGTGKTLSMIASAMELRRLGLARKPAIACLKANIEQITKSAQEAYPGARILSTADMFDAASRKETIARIATGDYDLILMTHDHMDMLQMKPETVSEFVKEELKEISGRLAEAQMEDAQKSRGGKAKGGSRVVKALEKAKANLEAKLAKAVDSSKKDDAVFFEETGIDQIFVDEAHNFKSLPVYTKRERVKGVPTSRSDRATNMLMRTRWLQAQNNGRGVVFATGTPVENTMAELYTMQKYLQPEDLRERGIDSFDAWASTFGDVDTKMEFTVSGEYKPVSRFARFTNIPELMQMTGQMMDVQRADGMLKEDGTPVIERPKRKDEVVISPRTAEMDALMRSLQERAKKLKAYDPNNRDNMLVICVDGRKGACDMRLLDASAPDDPGSKTNQCVSNILKLHQADPTRSQLIFSDIGVNPTKDGFHLYGDIINKLVEGGIPREKIADFSDLEGAKKEAAMEAMRRGDILIGIGSTKKLGTGVNVQDKLAALHHLDVPWTPAENEQRDGRGWRQGNENKEVKIHRYVGEGSLDQTFWQVISNKARFIKQVIGGESTSRVAVDEDSEELSPEQLMAAASGDPRILEKVNLDEEIKQLRSARARHDREQARFKDSVRSQESMIPMLERKAKAHKADADTLAGSPDFSLRLGTRTFDDRKEAAEALTDYLAQNADTINSANQYRPHQLGSYRGLKLMAEGGKLYLQGQDRYEVGDSLPSIESHARFLPRQVEAAEQAVRDTRADVDRVRAQIGKTWGKQGDLDEKTKRSAEIERLLKEEKNKQPGEGAAPASAAGATPSTGHAGIDRALAATADPVSRARAVYDASRDWADLQLAGHIPDAAAAAKKAVLTAIDAAGPGGAAKVVEALGIHGVKASEARDKAVEHVEARVGGILRASLGTEKRPGETIDDVRKRVKADALARMQTAAGATSAPPPKRTFTSLQDAAMELDAIRYELASGTDPEQLTARVDAVGQWAAAHGKQTGMAATLLREADVLRDRLAGGTGNRGNRIVITEPPKS